MNRFWLSILALGMLGALAFAACGDDDDDDGGGGGSEEERQEVADLALTLATTNGAEATQEEIDFYLAHITDEFVQPFGTESVDACAENAPECIGEPLTGVSVTADDVEVDGDEATAVVSSDFGPVGINFVREGDEWKAASPFVPNDEIPDGTEVVDLEMAEFAFIGEFDSDAVKSGDFAFHAENTGEQVHEVVLVALPEEGTIQELLEDESFQPEPIVVKFPYNAGDESDIVLPEPLAPGRYGLVCFLPDQSAEGEDAAPHAFLGMTAEFEVE